MKRWALIVAGLYLLILAVLTVPVIMLAFLPQGDWKEALAAYSYAWYWVVLGVMVSGQLALLAVPVRVASRRPVTRGALWPTLLAGGLMMGGMVSAACCCLYEFIFRDKGDWNWIALVATGLGGLTWCVWLFVFFRMSKTADARDVVSRQCQLLLKGSVLELLIAVPTHIVARYRGY